MRGSKFSNEEIEGLEKFDDAGEVLEVRITGNVNCDTSLDTCKGPPNLEEGGNTASESSMESENYDSEANNCRAT